MDFLRSIHFTKEQAVCAVRKDSGDDPDVTNGIAIYSRVSFRDDKPETEGYIWENEVIRLHLTAGEGVGIVTKPGLACEVGKPAINPVPREMIFTHVERACRQYGFQGSLHIEIFIPQGIEISKKTFNPRMGIKGGISLLGTSGMVEPMSEKALTDTIQLELHQKHVAGLKSMILTPGNYGESFLRDELNVNLDYAVKCSNFIGDSLDMAVQENIEEVLLVGHGGKLINLQPSVGVYFQKENMYTLNRKYDFILTTMAALAQNESYELILAFNRLNSKVDDNGMDASHFRLTTAFFPRNAIPILITELIPALRSFASYFFSSICRDALSAKTSKSTCPSLVCLNSNRKPGIPETKGAS